jgi:predicted dithiol-disulfide oxidoreductase (DUF899 family)
MAEPHGVVSQLDWLEARKQLLIKEKEFTRLRDELSQQRRDLPWERVEKRYAFDGPNGKESLSDLFGDRSQLIVFHFMFDPDWDAGCKSCSFWADNFDPMVIHLAQRDVGFVAISRAPYAKIAAYKKRMGWDFKWLSSFDSDFNYDYYVSFTPTQIASAGFYNYATAKPWGADATGLSVFCRDESRALYHTYSCYSRGVDMLNSAYQCLDLTPKGRDEAGQGPNPQAWVRRHDEYSR